MLDVSENKLLFALQLTTHSQTASFVCTRVHSAVVVAIS